MHLIDSLIAWGYQGEIMPLLTAWGCQSVSYLLSDSLGCQDAHNGHCDSLGWQGGDFAFLILNEIMPPGHRDWGGGGVQYFVQAQNLFRQI